MVVAERKDKILEPQSKSRVQGISQWFKLLLQLWLHPICPPLNGPAGKLPVQWAWEGEQWENAHFTFCRQE